MSQDFKFKYTEMREGNPATLQGKNETYETESHVRNVCFIWTNGHRIFLNYNYLVSGEYLPEENKIVLTFTTHFVTLIGIQMNRLYDDLLQHSPKIIIATDARYNATAEANIPLVNEINVTGND